MQITRWMACFALIACNGGTNATDAGGDGSSNPDACCNDGPPQPLFSTGVIASPTAGYIDSVFVTSDAMRIYFLHSIFSVNDFLSGTDTDPRAPTLAGHQTAPGLDFNSDLYYVEWNGVAWSSPVNLGAQVNTPGNECCMWLNADETEVIFYRDAFGITELGPTGNYRATRSSKTAAWGQATLLPGLYGSEQQTTAVYRHDIHKTPSGDLYLWERNTSIANSSRLLHGARNGTGWDAPAVITASDSPKEESQVWVAPDELTMVFNRRGPDGDTELIAMTRAALGASWGGARSVPLTGFADGAGLRIWGEPTFSASEDFMIYIRFDTSTDPWRADLMYAPGTLASGFTAPIDLN